MKTNAIQLINIKDRFYNLHTKTNKTTPQYSTNLYQPAYYKDYNVQINFKGGRNPEDFYAFNQGKMPETMDKYLNENYAERSKLAPVQVLKEAYDDLSVASTVDDIHYLYPNEEKFSKLRPADYANAKSGILRKIHEIKQMSDTKEPLFKDGCDDLTTYIVKKIYLEGKTVKEIDKDFAQDINPIYELAAKEVKDNAKSVSKNESVYFSHGTIYNLGIRFPQLDFWNSFISTRDDYAQTKRIKTASGKFVNVDSEEGKKEVARRNNAHTEQPKPRKYNFDRKNVKRIADTIANSKGDTHKALKDIKHSGRNKEELTFLQQYWSQIMSVATEKIHLSEELIDFNARKNSNTQVANNTVERIINGIDFTKREKLPLKIFWDERADLKEHFSNAIADTILLFTDVYGADGKNAEFEELIKYAENIKPNRELQKFEHEKIQAEYDKLAEELQAEDLKKELANKVEKAEEQVEVIIESKMNQPQNLYMYMINGEQYNFGYDIEAHSRKLLKEHFALVPSKLISTYMRELESIIPDKNRFWITCCYGNESENEQIRRAVYPTDEIQQIFNKQREIMDDKHNDILESSKNALLKYADKYNVLTQDEINSMYNADVIILKNIIQDKLEDDIDTAKKEIQTIFNQIHQPLTAKDKNKVKINLFQAIKNGNYEKEKYGEYELGVKKILFLMTNAVNENPDHAKMIKSLISSDKLLDSFGGSLRLISDDNTNPIIAMGIVTQALKQMIKIFPEQIYSICKHYPIQYNEIANEVLKYSDPENIKELTNNVLNKLR